MWCRGVVHRTSLSGAQWPHDLLDEAQFYLGQGMRDETESTLARAEEIARNEPFHVMGWRHNVVMTWTPKFGTLIGALRDSATAKG